MTESTVTPLNPLASLGLDQVSGNPNIIPDGKYDGKIATSDYVLSEKNDTVSHVVNLEVTAGDHVGRRKGKFWQLGKEVKDAQGNFPKTFPEVTNFSPVMTDDNKNWYKKFFLDMGVPEQEINGYDIKKLEGIPVTFGVSTRDGYQNVTFIERRTETEDSPASAVATAGGLSGLL